MQNFNQWTNFDLSLRQFHDLGAWTLKDWPLYKRKKDVHCRIGPAQPPFEFVRLRHVSPQRWNYRNEEGTVTKIVYLPYDLRKAELHVTFD